MTGLGRISLLAAAVAVGGCSSGGGGSSNARPEPLIVEPHESSSHLPGEVDFEGRATDAEDGTLPATALSWQVRDAQGDVVGGFQGASGTISLLVAGEYTAVLTAEDSKGKERSVEHPFRIANTVGAILEPDNHDVIAIAQPFDMTGRAETVQAGAFLSQLSFVGLDADGAEVFRLPVAVPPNTQVYETTVTPSVNAGRYRLRLEVNTTVPAEAAEDNIDVLADAPPQVTILSPADGTTVAPGASIQFSATVTDPGGGTPSIQWASSLEGALSQELEFTSTSLGRAKHRITLTATDENGLWDTASVDVYIEDAGSPLFADTTGLPDPAVNALAVLTGTPDAIWVGTENGLARVAADTGMVGASHTTGYNTGGDAPAFSAACIDTGECLFGLDGIGVSIRDAGDSTWSTFTAGLTDTVVNGIAQSPVDSDLFFATDNGITQTDADRTNPIAHDQGALGNVIRAVAVGTDGVVWAGTDDAGLIRLQLPSSVQVFDEDDGLAGNNVRAVAVDGDGNVWVGTDQGLTRFDPATLTFTTYENELPSDDVLSLSIDGDLVWIGTVDGVARYDVPAGLWTYFDGGDLAVDRVNAIVVDPQGAKWFGCGPDGSSNGGLTRYDGP